MAVIVAAVAAWYLCGLLAAAVFLLFVRRRLRVAWRADRRVWLAEGWRLCRRGPIGLLEALWYCAGVRDLVARYR